MGWQSLTKWKDDRERKKLKKQIDLLKPADRLVITHTITKLSEDKWL